jgi:hypothetical protein
MVVIRTCVKDLIEKQLEFILSRFIEVQDSLDGGFY